MTQILIICKINVDKSPKRPEFRGRLETRTLIPRLRHPTAAPAEPRPSAVNSGRERRHHCIEAGTG
jgi:hypothetical protein